MKKFFVAVALVMGLGTTVAFAENLTSGVETVMAVNDFTPIEVKDLPAAVTEAIAKNFAESTVKEAAVEAAEDDVPEDIVHSGKTWFVEAKLKQGIESAVQKKIVKLIKDSKLKVQAQIQGEEIRVTGKSRDDLQSVMALVRGGDLGQPFQFKNFRD